MNDPETVLSGGSIAKDARRVRESKRFCLCFLFFSLLLPPERFAKVMWDGHVGNVAVWQWRSMSAASQLQRKSRESQDGHVRAQTLAAET